MPSVEAMVMTAQRESTSDRYQALPPTGNGPRWRAVFRWVAGVVLVLTVLVVGESYCGALLYPGEASFTVRTIEWLRDNGASPLVDAVENWWYTRHAPSTRPRAARPDTRAARPFAVGMVDARTLPGHWAAGPVGTAHGPAMSSSALYPDSDHPDVLAAVARFDQRVVTAHLIAGTREPDRTVWPEGGQVPNAQRAGLVASFNSGFKMAGANGGYFAEGRVARPLRDGAASLVITRDGRVSVDRWGRDRAVGPDVVAVRQNLALIVDHGAVVPGLNVNRDDRWGSARNQLQYTWRSALGIDAAGNLYYVAGDKLTLATLATALADTGAVRGMELDIHPTEVHLFAYRHLPDGTPIPEKLLGTMRGPVDRYLRPDQRDFVTLTLR